MKCKADCEWYDMEGEIPRCFHPSNVYLCAVLGMQAFHKRPDGLGYSDCFAEYKKSKEKKDD